MAKKSEKRIDLENRAEASKVEFSNSIGDANLEERVLAAEAAQGDGEQGAEGDTPSASGDPQNGEPAVEVRGPKQGRRRAGRHFGPEPVVFQAGDLTWDELMALEGDPLITVVVRAADI